jgi:hypothetical protein
MQAHAHFQLSCAFWLRWECDCEEPLIDIKVTSGGLQVVVTGKDAFLLCLKSRAGAPRS